MAVSCLESIAAPDATVALWNLCDSVGNEKCPSNRKNGLPENSDRPFSIESDARLVHAAHATATRHGRRALLVFLPLDDHTLGREQQARDRRGVLQRRTRDLG